MSREQERECVNVYVVRPIQDSFKGKETFDTIFEGWVGFGFDRKRAGERCSNTHLPVYQDSSHSRAAGSIYGLPSR